jgi:hypothetical protein
MAESFLLRTSLRPVMVTSTDIHWCLQCAPLTSNSALKGTSQDRHGMPSSRVAQTRDVDLSRVNFFKLKLTSNRNCSPRCIPRAHSCACTRGVGRLRGYRCCGHCDVDNARPVLCDCGHSKLATPDSGRRSPVFLKHIPFSWGF